MIRKCFEKYLLKDVCKCTLNFESKSRSGLKSKQILNPLKHNFSNLDYLSLRKKLLHGSRASERIIRVGVESSNDQM